MSTDSPTTGGRPYRTGILIGVLLLAAAAAGLWFSFRNSAATSGLGGAWTYDLKSIAPTDPNLVAYEQVAVIHTGMAEPRGIAIDAYDYLWVGGDKAITILDANKGGPHECTTFGGGYSFDEAPRCIATSKDGLLAIAFDTKVFFRTGGIFFDSWSKPDRTPFGEGPANPPAELPLPPKAIVTSMCMTVTDIFIADAGNRVVWRYSRQGKILGRIGDKDANRNIEGFVIPSPHFALAMGKDTLLRVVNPGRHRIEAYTEGGDMEFAWGTFDTAPAGFCGCCNPTNIAILPDGSFVTSEKGLPRVKIYDANGVFQSIVAGPEAFKEDVQGLDLAAGPDGRIYVLDPSAKAVRVFAKKPAAQDARNVEKVKTQ